MTLMFRREILVPGLTPEEVFNALNSMSENCFWLDSGIGATTGCSYLGMSDEVIVARVGAEQEFLALLRAEIAFAAPKEVEAASLAEAPRFQLGWIGWFSYEFGQALLGLDAHYRDDTPPAVMLRVRTVVEIHHDSGAFSVLSESEETLDEWMREFDAALNATFAHDSTPQFAAGAEAPASSPLWREDAREYLARIEQCQAAIARGDAYLLCLTTQLSLETAEHPATLYRRLRAYNPAHHGGYISAAGVTLVSASPEQFLSVNVHGRAYTRPIKGTRRRDQNPVRDAALADELRTDTKELAENLMIVDLMRNDFSAVCDPASVRVNSLHAIESYEHVHQLVSTVSGQLLPEHDALDVFSACFPAGSMTGTPKHRAVSLLAEIENAPRGLYSGCFGYFSRDGSADLAMVIRSIVVVDGHASIGTGGGITADSRPEAEIAEIELKARPLLAALGDGDSPVM